MSRNSTLILLGILTILTPFSGLPIAIRTFLAVIFGVSVAGIGLSLRIRAVRSPLPPTEIPPTTEPVPPSGVSPI